MVTETLVIVEGDTRRRAELINFFTPFGGHVEPYETINELESYWPSNGIFVVSDAEDLVKQAVNLIERSGEWRPLVAYGTAPAADRVVDCLRMGAIDYLDIPSSREFVERRLNHISAYCSDYLERRSRWIESKAKLGKLTSRERQVLSAITQGLSNKAIAAEMAISQRTVEQHRANLMAKLQEKAQAGAVRTFIESELLSSGA